MVTLADIYSYGHLFARLMANGHHPFLNHALDFNRDNEHWRRTSEHSNRRQDENILSCVEDFLSNNAELLSHSSLISDVLAATLKRQPHSRVSSMEDIIKLFHKHEMLKEYVAMCDFLSCSIRGLSKPPNNEQQRQALIIDAIHDIELLPDVSLDV